MKNLALPLVCLWVSGCGRGLSFSGHWSGDCEFEDLLGPDGRFMELVYELDFDLAGDGTGVLTGSGTLAYQIDDIVLGSDFDVRGDWSGPDVVLSLVFFEELNDLELDGSKTASDVIEGDCVAGVAEGEFVLERDG